jgi:hypothetical protein
LHAAATVAKAEIAIVFAALFGMVVLRMLTGRINLDGLLAAGPGMRVSPERAQLLVASLGAAGYLLLSLGSTQAPAISFPSGWLIFLFGGSQATYLAMKYRRLLLAGPQDTNRSDGRK